MGLVEREITCPYCWEEIEIGVDSSVAVQEYVEDCSVCCRPILLRCVCEDAEVIEVTARAENE